MPLRRPHVKVDRMQTELEFLVHFFSAQHPHNAVAGVVCGANGMQSHMLKNQFTRGVGYTRHHVLDTEVIARNLRHRDIEVIVRRCHRHRVAAFNARFAQVANIHREPAECHALEIVFQKLQVAFNVA